VWWADWPRHQRHPVLLLSWDAHGDWRTQVTVAEITSNVRGLDAEVPLGRGDGLPRSCAANLDRIVTMRKSLLFERIALLGADRMLEVERAIHLALGIPLPCHLA
jgi:mRNA interferase MazF